MNFRENVYFFHIMKSIYLSVLLLNFVYGEKDVKKSSSRDVNDAVSTDYTLTKIPVYLLPNAPVSEGKIPVAVIPGAYPPATFIGTASKEAKPHKYGFYAPYKTPDVTPIHEPSSETYSHQKAPAYTYSDLNQKPDYESPSYKVAIIGKDYQTSTSFIKYEPTQKPLLEKHQSLSNGNIYASLAPALPYSGEQALGYAPSKKLTYDYQPQYYIKYVPVPYEVPQEQYAQHLQETYITPKPIVYKSLKKPIPLHDTESATAYATASEVYPDTKYAASYAPAEEPYQFQDYKYVQPTYKYYDKNIPAKKYVPTSYLVATIGKGATAHYSTNIQHDSPSHEPTYTTKLAPVPLPVDKYVVAPEDTYKSQAIDDEQYINNAYAYAYPQTKYKTVLSVPQYSDHENQSHYHKKDVVSSTKSYDSSTPKP